MSGLVEYFQHRVFAGLGRSGHEYRTHSLRDTAVFADYLANVGLGYSQFQDGGFFAFYYINRYLRRIIHQRLCYIFNEIFFHVYPFSGAILCEGLFY